MRRSKYSEAFKRAAANESGTQKEVAAAKGVAQSTVVAWRRKYRNKPTPAGHARKAPNVEPVSSHEYLLAENEKLRAKLGEVLVREFLES